MTRECKDGPSQVPEEIEGGAEQGMLSAAEIEESLRFEHERRGFELKGPGARDELDFFVKVVRAVLGLGNLRDGGHVVIGIDDKDPASFGPGLAEEELESWIAYDEVARGLAVYADPPRL